MQPLYGYDSQVALWVSDRIGRTIHPPFVAIGFMLDERLIAGAVFNDYVPGGNIELTFASDGPIERSMIVEVMRYVFSQLRCSRLSITTRADNEQVIDTAQRLGFKKESVRADYYGEGAHAALFRMKRRECKWLRE